MLNSGIERLGRLVAQVPLDVCEMLVRQGVELDAWPPLLNNLLAGFRKPCEDIPIESGHAFVNVIQGAGQEVCDDLRACPGRVHLTQRMELRGDEGRQSEGVLLRGEPGVVGRRPEGDQGFGIHATSYRELPTFKRRFP